ncbi:hypothetical protein [uncultured Dubosiella sp.]|uniref:hypothetical protein n=1 Tax=uncultured Dubosiella sp. TaxID=1937011 RepID=UPI002591BA67|nr:hypothetical protein [uncultured Dubosiella sp.]
MSDDMKTDHTMAEMWAGYEKYGIWNEDGLVGVREDAPEWLKEKWENKLWMRKQGIKV